MNSLEILLLEDNQDLAAIARVFLKRDNHHVTVCATAAIAVDFLKEHQFDIVMCDVRLGRADGGDVLQTARDIQPGAGLIVTSSISADVGSFNESSEIVSLLKPFTRGSLQSAIERATMKATAAAC